MKYSISTSITLKVLIAVTGIVILERHSAVVRLRNIFLSTFCDL